MALPNNKISTTLVANTLGTNSRDVGTLCTHQAINKWSKWKPIRHGKLSGLTENDLKTENYGLRPNGYFDLKLLKNLESPYEDWMYRKPLGGEFSPFRLGDFRNYNHHANPPLLIEFSNDRIDITTGQPPVTMFAFINQALGSELTLDDLTNEYKYAGMAIEDAMGVLVYNISDVQNPEYLSLNININDVTMGPGRIFPFLAKSQDPSDGVAPFPSIFGAKQFNIIKGIFGVWVEAKYIDSPQRYRTLRVDVKFQNNSGLSQSYPGYDAKIRKMGNPYGKDIETGEIYDADRGGGTIYQGTNGFTIYYDNVDSEAVDVAWVNVFAMDRFHTYGSVISNR